MQQVVYRINELIGKWETKHPGIRLTQKELAKKTGLRQSTISAICRNKNTGIEHKTIIALCAFFDCSIEELMTLQEEPFDES